MSGAATCEVCDAAVAIDEGRDPYAIARLTTGYVKLLPTQYFRGYTLFSARLCVREVYDLPTDVRALHLHEMAEVAHAVARAFRPRKLNYEALGNGTPHLHWHVIPRYEDDPHPRGPVWEDLAFLRNLWLGSATPDPDGRDEMRRTVLRELRIANVDIEREFIGG